jgi:hypothetical protein
MRTYPLGMCGYGPVGLRSLCPDCPTTLGADGGGRKDRTALIGTLWLGEALTIEVRHERGYAIVTAAGEIGIRIPVLAVLGPDQESIRKLPLERQGGLVR